MAWGRERERERTLCVCTPFFLCLERKKKTLVFSHTEKTPPPKNTHTPCHPSSAAAPEMISISSVVMAAWRDLL